MKKLALLMGMLLLSVPFAAAKATDFYVKQPVIYMNKSSKPVMSLLSQIKYNDSLQHGFRGLGGISGKLEPVEDYWGPLKPFGKPRPALTRTAPLPEHYVPLGGIANASPGKSADPCAQFQCKPGENVVADTVSKKYYRCYCDSAKLIKPENRKCFDTPGIAEKIGYKSGSC